MYCPDQAILHVHIPKCGGTSIYESCLAMGWETWGSDVGAGRCAAHWPAKDWRNLLGDEVWAVTRKFAVVRHPADLLVSWYHYQRDLNPPPNPHWIPPHVSFGQWMREYVDTVAEGVVQELNDLSWWITDAGGEIMVDEVIRLDEIADWWQDCCQRCGVGDRVSLPRKNATSHEPWQHYYQDQPDLRAIVRSRYARDFELFKWTF